MKVPGRSNQDDLPLVSIHIGGVFTRDEPTIVRTVLGSCVAVCLYDLEKRIGGMNHFLLPMGECRNTLPTSYGVFAMEELVHRCIDLGAQRGNILAKVFGGGRVLQFPESEKSVPNANIKFAFDFLESAGIRVATYDVGGVDAREIFLFTDSGRVLLRRVVVQKDLPTNKKLPEDGTLRYL